MSHYRRLGALFGTLILGLAAGGCASDKPLAEPSRIVTSAPSVPAAPLPSPPERSAPGATEQSSPGAPEQPSPARSSATPPAGPATTPPPGPATTPPATTPPATVPVPQPSSGDVNTTVAPRPVETQPAKKLDQSVSSAGLTVRLTSVKAVGTKARLPGEVSGPGVAVTVRVDNRSTKAVALGGAVVGLVDAADLPGTVMSGPPSKRLPSRVEAGRSAQGVYVFAVAADHRKSVTVTVSTVAEQPVLQFRGRPS